jgi:Ca2+-binding RTX toxin-like protein
MSRKAPALLAAIAVMVALFATAAYAASEATEITGTDKGDILYESQQNFRNDNIDGRGGNDTIRAGAFGRDADSVDGGSGIDTLNAADGDGRDTLDGGTGDLDKCTGDPENTYENSCEIIQND